MKKIAIVIFLLILCLVPNIQAQEELEEEIQGEFEEGLMEGIGPVPYDVTVYGEVSAVDKTARTITLLEYDYEKEEEVDVVYHIKENAELQGIDDLSDIKSGDWVDLSYYHDEDGKKIATFIAKEVEPGVEIEGDIFE